MANFYSFSTQYPTQCHVLLFSWLKDDFWCVIQVTNKGYDSMYLQSCRLSKHKSTFKTWEKFVISLLAKYSDLYFAFAITELSIFRILNMLYQSPISTAITKPYKQTYISYSFYLFVHTFVPWTSNFSLMMPCSLFLVLPISHLWRATFEIWFRFSFWSSFKRDSSI